MCPKFPASRKPWRCGEGVQKAGLTCPRGLFEKSATPRGSQTSKRHATPLRWVWGTQGVGLSEVLVGENGRIMKQELCLV